MKFNLSHARPAQPLGDALDIFQRQRTTHEEKVFKYLLPNLGLLYRELWQSGGGRLTKHVLHRVPLCPGNLGVIPLFQKAVPATNEAASAVCGWRLQGQCDNQMTAQHGKEPESVKRHHTGKRMILILRLNRQCGRNQSQHGRKARTLSRLSGEWEIPVLQALLKTLK
jgi:hypothetical protein